MVNYLSSHYSGSLSSNNKIVQNLQTCVIQIRDANGYIQGTGFVIDVSTAVTCAHVIEAAGSAPGQTVTIAFTLTGETGLAEVITDPWCPSYHDDIALLCLQMPLPPGVLPAILGPSEATSGHPFCAFGYADVGDMQGVWAEGSILGQITDSQKNTFLQLHSQQIAQGMSGGPVLDIHNDRVIGMVTTTYNPDETLKFRDAAFATPIEVIAKTWPALTLVPPEHSISGHPFQAPPLPAHFISRPEITNVLKARLLAGVSNPQGILVISAIQGLGGIGKSTLASSLAHDLEIQRCFQDGILWATLGQQPDLLSLLSGWIQALGDFDFRPTTIEVASTHLRTLLQDKAILLVVDDIWEMTHALPFRLGGPQGQVLITTRRTDVAEEMGAQLYQMDVMTPEQSLALLEARLGRTLVGAEQQQALLLAKVVGYLPLALDLGAVRISRGTTWGALCEALEKEVAELETLEDPRRRRKEASRLEASFNLSLSALRAEDEVAWQAFAWLGILPEDVRIAAPMAATLWKLEREQAVEMLELLWSEALLLPAPSLLIGKDEWRTYRFHDLLHDVARRLLITASPQGLGLTLPGAHAELLKSYQKYIQNGLWHTLPNDGYIHAHLTWHMEQARQIEEIHSLLLEETATKRNGWYEVQGQLGQIPSYLKDVARAWRVAIGQFETSKSTAALGHQYRYALINASLNSLASNFPPQLPAILLNWGVWSPELVLFYINRIQKPEVCAEALAEVTQFLPNELLMQVLSQVQELSNNCGARRFTDQTLAELVSRLNKFGDNQHALQAVQSIHSSPHKVSALVDLYESLPVQVIAELTSIGDKLSQVTIKALEAVDASDEEEQRLLQEWLEAVTEIQEPGMKLEWLLLPIEGISLEKMQNFHVLLQGEIFKELLQAAYQADERALTEGLYSNYLRHALEIAILRWPNRVNDLLQVACSVKNKYMQFKALIALIPHLQESEVNTVLQEALITARKIPEEHLSVMALIKVIELPQTVIVDRVAILSEVLQKANVIKDPWNRIYALARLSLFPAKPEYTPLVTSEQIVDASLAAAQEIDDLKDRISALSNSIIQSHLPDQIWRRIVSAAFSSIKDLPQGGWRGGKPRLKQWIKLLSYLPKDFEPERREALQGVLADISIDDGLMLWTAILRFSDCLSEPVKNAKFHELRKRANKVDQIAERAMILLNLSGYLPPAERTEILETVMEEIEGIAQPNSKDTMVLLATKLLPMVTFSVLLGVPQPNFVSLPELLVPEMRDLYHRLFEMTHSITDVTVKADALLELVPYLSEPVRDKALQKALEAIEKIEYENWQSERFTRLAYYFAQFGYAREALRAAQKISEPERRIPLLVSLIPPLYAHQSRTDYYEEVFGEVLKEVATMRNVKSLLPTSSPKPNRANLLGGLAGYLAVLSFEQYAKPLQQILPLLANHPRAELLEDLWALSPVISTLNEGKEAILEMIINAIQDVGRWWP